MDEVIPYKINLFSYGDLCMKNYICMIITSIKIQNVIIIILILESKKLNKKFISYKWII